MKTIHIVVETKTTTVVLFTEQYSEWEGCMISESLDHTSLTEERICSAHFSANKAEEEKTRLTQIVSAENERLKHKFEVKYRVVEQEVSMSGDPSE
ncbi:MAG: hypothetical protein WCG84_01190 [Candidatus Moraniibacteriota bacterium]